ncbi:hypothetical protein POM88_030571 [Heracleum sosnowskyi]|uniref:Uncharacterized protein n=1 Tax=Heracleum sosnowskyi TaxID=360622 RepID=A0AAD8HWP3_9APIA|nr:hypothetical protein POM88_030571 [Heracleum sosnowskyi]
MDGLQCAGVIKISAVVHDTCALKNPCLENDLVLANFKLSYQKAKKKKKKATYVDVYWDRILWWIVNSINLYQKANAAQAAGASTVPFRYNQKDLLQVDII